MPFVKVVVNLKYFRSCVNSMDTTVQSRTQLYVIQYATTLQITHIVCVICKAGTH